MGKRIAIDIDGVLRDFVRALTKQYKKDFPDDTVGAVTHWDLDRFFPIGRAIYAYYRQKGKEVFEEAEMYPNAKKFIYALYDTGSYVILLTSQPRECIAYTARWLEIMDLPFHSLVFTSDKGIFNYDILLDDGTHNLKSAREEGKRAICFNQPWNQDWDGERVNSYEQFMEVVNG